MTNTTRLQHFSVFSILCAVIGTDGHGTGTRDKEHQSEARIFHGALFFIFYTEGCFMNMGQFTSHPRILMV